MAADKASSSIPPWKYHVFLSFRGEDTRKGFTDHLYTALRQKSLITYRDDEELQRGEVIKQELLQAIQESLCTVVVLSQNYASSAWCLNELVNILECKKRLDRAVLPIFYDVDPSDVRNQKTSFAEAFKSHEEKDPMNKEMVQRWRNALEEVGNLSGWHSKDKHEAELIKEVVESVWKTVHPRFQCDYDGLVGIQSMIKRLDSHLRMGLEEVRFIGLWGMGGIGKTTLARALYETICCHFEISCFLANIKDAPDRRHGLVHLQSELLSRLEIKDMKIYDEFEGRKMIKNLLCNRKVLLVLDDVDHERQLKNLSGSKEWFGKGSRIIITTRDEHLLISHGVDDIHKLELLNEDEALLLFCCKAFKRNQPKEDFLQLSKEAVQYAKGLPLALEVLGSLLCERTGSEWHYILNKLNQSPPEDIMQTLRISFDNLDDEQKNIFLDIACFYNGMARDHLRDKLTLCGYNAKFGIKVLVEKSLITQDGSILRMHDLLEEMGRKIVVQQSSGDVGRRSRLWRNEDICKVLGENKGTEAIQAIVPENLEPISVYLEPDCFSKMHNLKLLHISLPFSSDLKPHKNFNGLPRSLKYLVWHGYPFSSLPLAAQPDELLVLEMPRRNIELWNGNQLPKMLKVVDLSYSEGLLEFPDVSGAPNLEKLSLEYCFGLVRVHPSLAQHKKLVRVNLARCSNLKSLPSILEMDSLELLNITGCNKLRKLPDFGENMKCLSVVLAGNCGNLVHLPETIFHLNSLKVLNISRCSKISRLPEILKENEALEELNCSYTAITKLTSSISLLKNLKKLYLQECGVTKSKSWKQMLGLKGYRLVFPPTFSALSSLKKLNLSWCNLSDGSVHDVLSSLPSSLHKLRLTGNEFVNLPAGCFSDLVHLRILHLDRCPNLRSLPELPPCVEFVDASNCYSMEPLSNPQQLWDLLAPLDMKAMKKDCLRILVPRTEIASWFDNQNYFIPNNISHGLSVVVDIPDLCCSSQRWGIAVCLKFKEYAGCSSIYWKCANPKTKTMVCSSGRFPIIFYSDRNLILFLRCEHDKLWQHQRGDHDQVQLTLHFPRFPSNLPIEECGCCVISEQDSRDYRKTMLHADTSSNRP